MALFWPNGIAGIVVQENGYFLVTNSSLVKFLWSIGMDVGLVYFSLLHHDNIFVKVFFLKKADI